MLEIFGQLFISTISSLFYIFYFIQPKLLLLNIFLPAMADVGGLVVGSSIGNRPFAESISSKKTVEGVIGAWVFCVGSALLCYYINQ